MVEQKKERKSNLLTIRLTDEETNALEYLSEQMGKNKSDVIARACKYFTNTDAGSRAGNLDGSGTDEKERMTVRVHARLTDSDMDRILIHGMKSGDSVSQIVRKAITALAGITGRSY